MGLCHKDSNPSQNQVVKKKNKVDLAYYIYMSFTGILLQHNMSCLIIQLCGSWVVIVINIVL